ncbi:MAG TPA: hypothetical protein VFP10_14870, partial [Candidatus Eisenbacteria bacterium]|nr:hypothetical protein [Candidatus Eisenbacteria bacterium]
GVYFFRPVAFAPPPSCLSRVLRGWYMAVNGMSHKNLAMPLARLRTVPRRGSKPSGIFRGEDDNYRKAMGRAA